MTTEVLTKDSANMPSATTIANVEQTSASDGEEKMLTMQLLENISNNSDAQFNDDESEYVAAAVANQDEGDNVEDVVQESAEESVEESADAVDVADDATTVDDVADSSPENNDIVTDTVETTQEAAVLDKNNTVGADEELADDDAVTDEEKQDTITSETNEESTEDCVTEKTEEILEDGNIPAESSGDCAKDAPIEESGEEPSAIESEKHFEKNDSEEAIGVADNDVVQENASSSEEVAQPFVFTFDEDERMLFERDRPTFEDEETYSYEETYLSDEDDELMRVRDSYTLYKREVRNLKDYESTVYTKKKKDDFVDQACAAIDRFYWRLTSTFIKTNKTLKETAKKGKAVAEKNINSERWSTEIQEAKKAKEVVLKSFLQCTAMGYDIHESEEDTVGINESFSTASIEDKRSNENRADNNTKKLFRKDCKNFSNFAGMSSAEANRFFESAQPSVMEFHDNFITPCIALDDDGSQIKPPGSPSQKLSNWLNDARTAKKAAVIDSVLIDEAVSQGKSTSTHDAESKDSTPSKQESECNISEGEKNSTEEEVEEREASSPTSPSEQQSSSSDEQSTLEKNDAESKKDLIQDEVKLTDVNERDAPITSNTNFVNAEGRTTTVRKTKKQSFWRKVTKKKQRKRRSEDSIAAASVLMGETGCEVMV